METDEMQKSYTDPTNCYTAIEGDKLFIEIPIFIGGDLVGYKRQLVMTKEIFIKCYEKWILNKSEEEGVELG